MGEFTWDDIAKEIDNQTAAMQIMIEAFESIIGKSREIRKRCLYYRMEGKPLAERSN